VFSCQVNLAYHGLAVETEPPKGLAIFHFEGFMDVSYTSRDF
jgi:hypothetical protein